MKSSTALSIASLPKGILFDLDDTILVYERRRDVLRRIALKHFPEDNAALAIEVADAIDAASDRFWGDPKLNQDYRMRKPEARLRIITGTLAALEAQQAIPQSAEFRERLASDYDQERESSIHISTSALAALLLLRARGISTAIVTNGGAELQRGKIERFGIAGLFDHIQIEGEVGFGKPDERAYATATAALKLSYPQCWMVGDNLHWEVAAAQDLGMKGIWFDHFREGLPTASTVRPDKIIQCLTELFFD